MNDFNQQSKAAATTLVDMYLQNAAKVSCFYKQQHSYTTDSDGRSLWSDEVAGAKAGETLIDVIESSWTSGYSALDGNYYCMVGVTDIATPSVVTSSTYTAGCDMDDAVTTHNVISPNPELWCFWPDFVNELNSRGVLQLPTDDYFRELPNVGMLDCVCCIYKSNSDEVIVILKKIYTSTVDRVEVLPLKLEEVNKYTEEELEDKFPNIFKNSL
jgi:hypothetical protein